MSALAAVLLLTSPAEGAIATEYAFARAAQIDGQWTAFRAFADEDGILFTPQPSNVHEALEGLADPVAATHWWPARSFVSCDGSVAVNTGPWVRAHQDRFGYFVTVWQRQQDDSWRWLLDDGRDLDDPMAAGEGPEVRRADCSRLAPPPPAIVFPPPPAQHGHGRSTDGTLYWHWHTTEDGGRRLEVNLFDGQRFEEVLVHEVEAPLQ
ncbi:MAG: hypothetical protein AAGE05_06235 [Pseudomonadota bacterium]